MISIKPVPFEDLIKVFGDFGDESVMVKLSLPFPLRASWHKETIIRTFYGHRYIADAVEDAYEEILDCYGYDFIRQNNLDVYGGCYANRKTVTGKRKSIHAWGLAVDVTPELGPYGKPSLIPYQMVDAFKKRGFVWGGEWRVPDGMHFSAIVE